MPTTGLASVREVRRREPLAPSSFNLVAGLAATTLAAALLLVGLLATDVPPRSLSSVLFSWSPTGAAIALPIVAARARRDRGALLGWFAAGLLVCVLAMVAQLLSHPVVDPAGGPLGTDPQSNAALYLLFHLSLYVAALAGAVRLPAVLAWPLALAGLALAVAVSLDGVPLPGLIEPDRTEYTGLLIDIEIAAAVLGAVAVLAWVRAAGSPTTPLRAWIGLALTLSAFEVTLNAVAAERYDAMWWSSLSLRLATFAVLAAGCIWTVVRDLGRVERYSEVELGQRDRELRGTVAVTDLLLSNAQGLGRCRTVVDVAGVVRETLTSVSGVDRVSLAALVDGHLTVLGADRDGPPRAVHERVVRQDPTLWWESPDPIAAVGGTGMALAALRLEVSEEPVGSLTVVSDRPRLWSPADRELLTGVADQAAQALARALLTERDRDAALTLQDALTPTAPPTVPGLEIALRYVPATAGTRVGGDWVDCWALPDGRVALVVGDVVGKGLGAAATMGRLRAALRALVQVEARPSVVLGRLDELESVDGGQMVATVLYALLDPVAGHVTVGRAGHLPLIVSAPGAPARIVDEGGSPPIGVGSGSRPDVLVHLPDDAVLALYTDGLVERRSRSLGEGLATLQDALATPYDGAERAADGLMGTGPAEPTDDIALLVVRVEGASGQPAGVAMSHHTHLPETVE